MPGSNDPHDRLVIPNVAVGMSPEGMVELTHRGFDPWYAPHAIRQVNSADGRLTNYDTGTFRFGDDIILTNVLSFDVKAWDPGAPIFLVQGSTESMAQNSAVVLPGDIGYLPSRLGGALGMFMRDPQTPHSQLVGFGAYVDLFYMAYNLGDPHDPSSGAANRKYENRLRLWERQTLGNGSVGAMPRPAFAGRGDERSGLAGPEYSNIQPLISCVYDTYTTHYERDGLDNNANGIADEGTNGIDDNGNGLIDEAAEQETAPPYAAALRGIQVKLRVFESDSRAIREVTLVHEFIPE